MIVSVEQKAGWLPLAFLLAQLCRASGTEASGVSLKQAGYSTQEVLLFSAHSFYELCSLP